MIKGSHRQMIVIRTSDSRYFDEAYFVLRKELKEPRPARTDILREANRLLSERVPPEGRRSRHSLFRWLFFGVGALCGALLTLAVCLIAL